MTAAPAISVCIPSYNSARWLPLAIESVLAQTFEDYELVVCDNASTDDTAAVCARYPRVRRAYFERLVGQAGNWNRCVAEARGRFVVLLHADDELAPAFLERAHALASSDPAIGLVHCAALHIDTAGGRIAVQSAGGATRVDPPGVLLERLLVEGCLVNPAGVLVPSAVYDAVGPFSEHVTWCIDWHMWARIAMRWKTGYLADELARYREHPQSGTSKVSPDQNGIDELWVLHDLLAQLPGEHAHLRARRDELERAVAHRTWCFAEALCAAGREDAARSGLRRAIRIDPRLLATPKTWALYAATRVGYRWFERLQALRGRG